MTRAVLRPMDPRKQETVAVELLARVGRGKVKVRTTTGPGAGQVFAAFTFRLHDADNRRRLRPDEIAALPWQGKGRDPASPEASHGAPPHDPLFTREVSR